MNKRSINIIDNLITENTGRSKLILQLVCIFFNCGREHFGDEYLMILAEYMIYNTKTVDEMVINCTISHSGYYRKINYIYKIIDVVDKLINEAFLELKIDDNYIKTIISKSN